MNIVICSAKRSPIASFQGALASLTAPQIAAPVLSQILAETKLDPTHIDEIFMGCVLTAGVGQAPARQAALAAGFRRETPATTVGKVCGSGLRAVMFAANQIKVGEAQCIVAGGMESMSQSPYLLPKIREGLRMGNGDLVDSMIKDGLWDVYNNFHMGNAAEICAREYKITRELQDEYAHLSYRRAQEAQKKNLFQKEIVPIEIPSKKGPVRFEIDEEPQKYRPEKVADLRPVFEKTGTVTAFNASSLNDGAAALLICSEDFAKKHSLTPLARIVSQGSAAQAPEWFTTAPTPAIQKALKRADLSIDAIDRWEINEAFASVALVNRDLLKSPADRINVRGGAIALGHPIGASGARVLTTLVHTLHQEKLRYGVASLCIGGGEGVAMVVENMKAP
jgi:acetyl-CoA C-acetyltransferase